jgi:hypothetical protein
MLAMLFSGKFPSAKHRNTYTGEGQDDGVRDDGNVAEDPQSFLNDPGNHEDWERFQQIKVNRSRSV